MNETQASRSIEISIHRSLCKGIDGCGLCMHVCPADVYVRSDDMTSRGVHTPVAAHPDRCSGCKRCVIFCPDFAIVVETGNSKSDES